MFSEPHAAAVDVGLRPMHRVGRHWLSEKEPQDELRFDGSELGAKPHQALAVRGVAEWCSDGVVKPWTGASG